MAAVGPAATRADGRLRVALLVDSPLQPRWLVEGIARFAGTPLAEIVAIVDCPGGSHRRPLAWWACDRVDRRVFGLRPDPLAPTDLRDSVPQSAWLSAEALRLLRVDVAFALGGAGVPPGIQARFGVWWHFFGAREDDAIAGADELIAGDAVVRSGLMAQCHEGPPRVVCESWSRTFDFSLARTRDGQLAKASAFAERALRALQRGGESWFSRRPVEPAQPASPPIDGLRLVGAMAAGMAGAMARKLATRGQWFIASRMGPGDESPAGGWSGDLTQYRCRLPPADRFWADPFPLARHGRHYIFFEELPYAANRAHIACVEVRADGSWSEPRKVLERPYHLSYPFLFEHQGALFMMPETGDRRTVEVYRCRRFPDEWTLEQVLLEGAFFTDATLHRAPDRWWLFVNRSPEGTQGVDELNLFHAADPFAPWQEHFANPVKSDVRGARPAGRLYQVGDVLYRPGQIGAPIYGHGVAIHRIDQLTPGTYRETEVARVTPVRPRGLLGVHTVNRAGRLSVMDGFLRRPRLSGRTALPGALAYGQ